AELLAGLYDPSLDALKAHNWQWNRFQPDRSIYAYWNAHQGFARSTGSTWLNKLRDRKMPAFVKRYAALDGLTRLIYPEGQQFMIRGLAGRVGGVAAPQASARNADAVMEEVVVVGYGTQEKQSLTGSVTASDQDAAEAPEMEETETAPPVRTNLQETAFFLPHLQTDAEGNV